MIKVTDKSKIKTEKIFFKLSDKESAERMIQSFDYVPYVYIKKIDDPIEPKFDGTNIDPQDINYVKLFNNKFLPEIELSCYDSKGILFNDLYPFDHDTLLCIFVKSNSENTMPIRMDFRVTEYETTKSGDYSQLKYLIKGILNVDELHYTKFEAYDDTSFNVLKKLALNFNLGFATNISNSNDKMKWINPAIPYLEFINNVSKHSYISDDSFIWTFIDFYYNLNYVDIQKEMIEFNKDEESMGTDKKFDKDAEEKNVSQYLTNNIAFNMSNKYIFKFNLVNQSLKTNLNTGYNAASRWYNSKNFTVYKEKLKELQNDQTKLSKGEGDTLIQLIDKDSDISKNNFKKSYLGKLDPDNCHEKYCYAEVLNDYNIFNMDKMKMQIYLRQINFDIKRFQNIKVEIWNIGDVLSKKAAKKAPLQNINERLSGYWYVTGINYLYRKNGGHEQEITLMRRDLSKNYGEGDDEKKDLRNTTKNK